MRFIPVGMILKTNVKNLQVFNATTHELVLSAAEAIVTIGH